MAKYILSIIYNPSYKYNLLFSVWICINNCRPLLILNPWYCHHYEYIWIPLRYRKIIICGFNTWHRTLYIIFYATAAQVISVGLLGLAIFLIYAVLSFAFLHNFFNPYDMDYNLFCNTLIQCSVTVIREGLLDTLGAVSRLFNVCFKSCDFSFNCHIILLFCHCRHFLFDMLVKVTIHLLQFIGPELFLMLHSSLLWLHWAWILW